MKLHWKQSAIRTSCGRYLGPECVSLACLPRDITCRKCLAVLKARAERIRRVDEKNGRHVR